MPKNTYTLTAEEQEAARTLTRLRYESNRSSGVRNNKIGNQSNEETDLEGIGAEIAFGRMFKCPIDTSIEPRSGGEDTVNECSEGLKKTVDIKTTTYENGRLLAVRTKKKGETDLFVLMVGKFPTYRFAGFATEDELLRPENLKDLGHGPTYALDQSKLHKIDLAFLD